MDAFLNAGNPDRIAREIVGDPGDPANGLLGTPGESWGVYTNGYPTVNAASSGFDAPPDVAIDNISNLNFQSDQGGIR